ncbi:hypothetical protein RUND412_010676 [Rhizina undulata]
MIPHRGAPRANNYYGFLIDLDHAQRISSAPSRAPERTGTYPFLSVEVLEGSDDFAHTFYGDLQNFWFVFLLLCTPEDVTEPWHGSTLHASSVKLLLGSDDTRFRDFVKEFPPEIPAVELEALKTAATECRRTLWPQRVRFDRQLLGNDVLRDRMYDGMVRAFDKGVFIIDPVNALFGKELEGEA